MSTFSDWADLMHVNDVKNDWGQLSCGCHPNCGTGMAVMIDKETKEAVPVTAFLNGDQLAQGHCQGQRCGARRRFLTVVGMALCLMKNYDPFQSPTHFKLMDLLKKFDKNFNATGKNYGEGWAGPDDRRRDEAAAGPLELPVHRGDVVPGSVQLRLPADGAVHYSVRDAGRRDFVLRLQHGRGLAEHYREDAHDGHAHQVVRGARAARDFCRRQECEDGIRQSTTWCLRDEIVTNEVQHDLDKLGIAKNAREEKMRARDAKQQCRRGAWPQKNDAAYNARMAALYREVVLKEKPVQSQDGFIPLGALMKPSRRSRKLGNRCWGIKASSC